MKSIVRILLLGCCMVLLAGCEPGERQEIDLRDRIGDAELRRMELEPDSDVLQFVFDLRASSQEDARQYVPFLKYLEKATGHRFRLRFTPKDGKIENDVDRCVVQFAAVGCGTYIKAREEYGVVPLVRRLNERGKAEYQSVIIVAPEARHRPTEEAQS